MGGTPQGEDVSSSIKLGNNPSIRDTQNFVGRDMNSERFDNNQFNNVRSGNEFNNDNNNIHYDNNDYNQGNNYNNQFQGDNNNFGSGDMKKDMQLDDDSKKQTHQSTTPQSVDGLFPKSKGESLFQSQMRKKD